MNKDFLFKSKETRIDPGALYDRLFLKIQDLAMRIGSRIAELESTLQSVPKGRHWEKRAKVGAAKPWFREVEEVVR